MADIQPGNRYAEYPKPKKQPDVEIEQHEIKYDKTLTTGDASRGGAIPWESHPNPENKFTTDTLHPKKNSQ